MAEKNYNRKKAKDFNFLTTLYQRYGTYIIFLPIMRLFNKFKVKRVKLDPKSQYIYAPNHISYCDPFLVAMTVKPRVAFMAKKELYEAKGRLGRWLATNVSTLGAFAVNREKVEVSTIKTSLEVYKAGFSLCIFPEGGIRKNKRIEEINKGFIAIAKMVKKDIVPIGIKGLEEYSWNIFKKTNVEIIMGEVISYELDEDEIVKLWKEQISKLTGYEIV